MEGIEKETEEMGTKVLAEYSTQPIEDIRKSPGDPSMNFSEMENRVFAMQAAGMPIPVMARTRSRQSMADHLQIGCGKDAAL